MNVRNFPPIVLDTLYWNEKLTFKEIAEKLESCRDTISRKFREYGIPHRYRQTYHHSEKFKKNVARTLEGHMIPRKVREKISKSLIGNTPWNKGIKLPYDVWNKGKHLSEEHKQKISENHSDFSGRNHWNWQGGKSFEPYSPEFNEELKERIRNRDNYRCQICGISENELNYALCIHHIDEDKKNNSLTNLISLCISCHMKKHRLGG